MTAQPAPSWGYPEDAAPRPRYSASGGGPGARAAEQLYEATSGLPMRRSWGEVPDELADYLELVYRAGEQALDLTRSGPAEPWGKAEDDGTCWVSFTGGKDSVAAALRAEQQGYRPRLLHVRGLNRGMMDEILYAQALADFRGWELHVRPVSVSGKKAGLMELPTKNQVSTLTILDAAQQHAEEAGEPMAGVWSAGWHGCDAQGGQGFDYDFSDGDEAIRLFGRYVDARWPGTRYIGDLWDTVECWARVADAGLLGYVKGCVAPIRFKRQWRERNEERWGPLLPGRCGSCVKCAWEQIALEELGILEPRPEMRRAQEKFILRDFAHRASEPTLEAAVEEFCVPAASIEKWKREPGEWPEQAIPPWAPLPKGGGGR